VRSVKRLRVASLAWLTYSEPKKLLATFS